MKPLLHLTWLRLKEQPAKILYLAATLTLAVLAWTTLSAFASPSLLSNSNLVKSKLWLANGRAQHVPFPVRYIPRIQQIPGVDSVSWFTMAAFFCADGSGTTVTVTGLAGDYMDELRENGTNEAELSIWKGTENGVLVGADIAKQCGLPQGITISPVNLFGTGELPLHVIAVLPERGGRNDRDVIAHYDYINRFMDGPMGAPIRDTVMRATVNIIDPSRLDQMIQAIEQEFQSSDPPLEVIVLGDANALLGRFGQMQTLLLLIMGALALCTLLVFVSITAHLVARRHASMAILQTLGFNAKIQFFALVLELTCILIVGTLLGIAAGYEALALLTPWAADTLLSGALHPADGAMLVLPPALLLLLLSTLVFPYLRISRLKPVDHLNF